MAKKVVKGHIAKPGVKDSYRYLLVGGKYEMVHPVKIGGVTGMGGQIFKEKATQKELAVYEVIRDTEGVPLPYKRIGISAREYMEKAAE